jgi:hypothetical protein
MKAKLIFPPLVLIAFFVAAITSMNNPGSGSVKGRIDPADAGQKVYIFNKADTFDAPVQNGQFSISGIKSGTYNLLIQAHTPYKDKGKKGIRIRSGRTTSLGTIKLEI